MQITQDVTVQADPALSAVLAGKNHFLQVTIDPSVTSATWQLNGEEGRPGLNLYVRDRTGSRSSATIPPVVLKNEAELTARLSSLNEALRKVRDWRKAIDALFVKIRPWCQSLPGNPHVQDRSSMVIEERSGGYDVPELLVTRGSSGMIITPVAAWVVGWDGRVDMIGPGDRAILHHTRATDEWFHVPNYLPYRKLPLTSELFRELVEACLDG